MWQLFEGVCSLLDRLGAWPHLANGTADLREMAQIGLHLVLGYILLEDPQVDREWSWGRGRCRCRVLREWLGATCTFFRPQLHAQAHVRLHSLLQTAVPMRHQEACYVLSKLEAVLARALHASPCKVAPEDQGPPAMAAASTERCSWLVPLVRTLLDRAYEPLGLQWGLPSLPPTNGSPTFFEDFQDFCATPEWRHFIDKQVPGGGDTRREVWAGSPHRALSLFPCPTLQVQPTMSQFEMDTYAKSHDLMSGFWNSCYDTLMSSGQRRQQERAHSCRNFQVCSWGEGPLTGHNRNKKQPAAPAPRTHPLLYSPIR